MTTKQKNNGKRLYQFKIDHPDLSWRLVGEHFGISQDAARKRSERYAKRNKLPPPNKVIIEGGIDTEPSSNGREQWSRALAIEERQDRLKEHREQRRVIYDSGPVVLVFMADLHLGGMGVKYSEVDRDIRTLNILADAGIQVGVLLVGDMLDGYIVGRLQELRKTVSPFLMIEEWGLVDYALERLAPYLIGSVGGNHDNWSWSLVGVDLLRQRHQELTPGILYDPLELAFCLQVAGYECRVMLRHKWRGNSMYNPTHGLEHGHHTRGREFDIAAGAHTHRGGLAREFDNGSGVGHALICGSYKKADTYAMAVGFPPPLNTSAVAAVIDDDGILFSTSNIDGLLRVLK